MAVNSWFFFQRAITNGSHAILCYGSVILSNCLVCLNEVQRVVQETESKEETCIPPVLRNTCKNKTLFLFRWQNRILHVCDIAQKKGVAAILFYGSNVPFSPATWQTFNYRYLCDWKQNPIQWISILELTLYGFFWLKTFVAIGRYKSGLLRYLNEAKVVGLPPHKKKKKWQDRFSLLLRLSYRSL